MQISLTRRRRLTRIDDDPQTAVVALLPEKLVQNRKGFSAVRSGDQQDFSERNVAPWIGRAVDAESFVVTRRRRHHAQSSVVIDIASAESGTRELSHQVSLLGRQRRTRINADRIFAMVRLQLFELRDDEIQCLVPTRAFKTAVAFDQRIEQAIRMMDL